MKRNLLSLIALFSLALTFTACKKQEEFKGPGYIQIVNASETSSPFDFYIDNEKVNPTTLQYNQSTSYISVNSGQHNAFIKIPTSGVANQGFLITPQVGAYYSIYYFGNSTIAYQDILSTPPANKASVRFINLNEELSDDLDFSLTGGEKLVSGLSSFSDSPYYTVDPNASFTVYKAGTTTVIATVPTAIQGGHIYTVYLSGQNKGSLKGNFVLQK